VRVWTAHIRPSAAPVLVREGFSFGAFFFGPLWLAAHRAWIPAAFALAVGVLIGVFTTDGARSALELGLAFLLGLVGRDLVRWSLGLRGYRLVHVLAARDTDSALARLLAARPELAGTFMPAESAR
jgi:hypothetical protein